MDEIRQFCEKDNFKFFEISSLNKNDLNECFIDIFMEMININYTDTEYSQLSSVEEGKNKSSKYNKFYNEYQKIKENPKIKVNSKKSSKTNELMERFIKLKNTGKTNEEALEELNIPPYVIVVAEGTWLYEKSLRKAPLAPPTAHFMAF